MTVLELMRKHFSLKDDLYRCLLTEFFCTTLLMFAGTAVNAQFVLSKGQVNAWIGVNIGWGLALVMAIYPGFNISGSHLNPAVSFYLYTLGQLSALRFVLYSIVQIMGGFMGALLAFVTYFDAIKNFDNGTRYVTGPLATAGMFATYPQPYLSVFGGVFDQIVGTAYLCICVSLITDKHRKIPEHLQPLLIGFVVMLIGMSVGMNCGYAINPARDLGPRLFTLCAGYGKETFSFNNYKWFWIPTFVPMLGAVIGAWTYQIFIGIHNPEGNQEFGPNVINGSPAPIGKANASMPVFNRENGDQKANMRMSDKPSTGSSN